MRGPSRTPSSILSPQSNSLLTVRLSGDMRLALPLNPSTASTAVDGGAFCRDPFMCTEGISLILSSLGLLSSGAPWWHFITLCFASASVRPVTTLSSLSFLFVTDREELRCGLECREFEAFLGFSFSSSAFLCDFLALCCTPDSPLWRSFKLLVATCRGSPLLLHSVLPLCGVWREALTGVRAKVRRLRFSESDTESDGICSVVGFWRFCWASDGASTSMGWRERVRLLSLSERARVISGDLDWVNTLFPLWAAVSSLLEPDCPCASALWDISQCVFTFASWTCSLLPRLVSWALGLSLVDSKTEEMQSVWSLVGNGCSESKALSDGSAVWCAFGHMGVRVPWKSWSWPRKLKFGEMEGLRSLTNLLIRQKAH